MKTSFAFVCLLGSLVMVMPAEAGAAELEVGFAAVDITPPIPFRMSGYFSERLSTGIHDPLWAKAVVFRQGDRQVAMVFCDISGIAADISTNARRMAETRTGIPYKHIIVAATHSHTGPLYAGALRKHFHDKAVAEKGNDVYEKVDYPAQLTEKVARAIAEAQAALEPMKVHAGTARQKGLSFNRRFHMKGGGDVRFNPGVLNPNILRPAGPIDPEVGLLLFRDPADSRPLGALTVFALHLDTTGGTLYSADFPYYLAESLKRHFSPEFVSLFGIGACGDINHIDVTTREQLKPEKIGATLAAAVKTAATQLPAIARPSLAAASETVDAPLQRYSPEDVAWARKTMERVGDPKAPFLERVKAAKIMDLELRQGDTLPAEIQVVRLGDDVAVVSLPGEFFVELGMAIKKASPFSTTIIFELANDAIAYVPTQKAFAEGSYETVNSRVTSGSGEKMVDAALRLLGQLKP